MPYTEDELFAKLERADAAGDGEAAKAIADEIRSMRSAPVRPMARKGGEIRNGQFVNSVGRIPQANPNAVGANPTEGMTGSDLFWSGAGKSIVDTGIGLGQIGAWAMDKVAPRQQGLEGLVSGQDNSRSAAMQRIVDQHGRTDDALMRTPMGVVGDVAGQYGQLLVPGTDAGKLVSYSGKGAGLVKGAVQGAAFAGTQPVVSGGSRGEQIGYGGLFGAGGAAVADGLGAVARGTRSRLDDVSRTLAAKAEQYGIPLGVGQLSNNGLVRTVVSQMERLPFSGARKANEARQEAFNRAVGETFGAPEAKITPDVFADAQRRIGDQFETIAARNTLPATPSLLAKLGKIRADAQNLGGTETAARVNNWITRELLGKADAKGNIPGAAYKSFDSRIGKATLGGGEDAFYLGQVREAVRNAMDNAISPRDAKAWALARKQYAALKQVEPLVGKSPTGDISPQALMGRATADRAGKARMARGNGGAQGDLARIGQRFLKESPNSGTADRLLVNGAVGGALYGAQGLGFIDPETALLIGGGLAANRVGLGVLNSRALSQGGSRTLTGLARLAQPAPRLLPAAYLATGKKD